MGEAGGGCLMARALPQGSNYKTLRPQLWLWRTEHRISNHHSSPTTLATLQHASRSRNFVGCAVRIPGAPPREGTPCVRLRITTNHHPRDTSDLNPQSHE
eukprot:scaffold58200_cov25-Tisochrysis_lutea.AAC.1